MAGRETIRLLVADASPVSRFVLKRCLAKMGGVEVVGEARDGREALEKTAELHPDVVALDVAVPRMRGVETLREMRRRFPDVPVIVLAGAGTEGAARALDALEDGAFEFVLKPGHGPGGERRLIELLRPRLIEAARRARGRPARTTPRSTAAPRPALRAAAAAPSGAAPDAPPDVVAIGSSTGGPGALHAVLRGLSADFPLPIVITQHMPAGFLVSLAGRLTRETPIEVRVAEDGMPLAPGKALLAPGGRHMHVVRRRGALAARLDDGPSEHHCKPAVDPMFRSLAALAPGVRTLAVVLTGMGEDGAAGALAIREAGGHVIAQDEATSAVWGMPGATVKRGAADRVLPLGEIAPAILAAARGSAGRRERPAGTEGRDAITAV